MPRVKRHPLVMPPAVPALLLAGLLAGCGSGFSGSGNGFGGFGGSRVVVPEAEANGYTMRRLTGRADEVTTLQPDTSVRWPDAADEERPSIFETDEERRAREQRQRQTRRGSSSESPDLPREPNEPLPPRQPEPPRALAPPPENELRGQAIPGAPPGTVSTGQTGRTGTFGGPGGTGTTIRDGGTTTLMGADGTIRTVPTPR
ncbi:hypothetical protein [Elioraea rosea]|uniref:hypothetical protein n=1 Tax=Elioraea rosea TaxID=2492390 RepID=UPI0011858784|nr:hypothetical protein [Elioraea rosea]